MHIKHSRRGYFLSLKQNNAAIKINPTPVRVGGSISAFVPRYIITPARISNKMMSKQLIDFIVGCFQKLVFRSMYPSHTNLLNMGCFDKFCCDYFDVILFQKQLSLHFYLSSMLNLSISGVLCASFILRCSFFSICGCRSAILFCSRGSLLKL